jgi:hypothetical protein
MENKNDILFYIGNFVFAKVRFNDRIYLGFSNLHVTKTLLIDVIQLRKTVIKTFDFDYCTEIFKRINNDFAFLNRSAFSHDPRSKVSFKFNFCCVKKPG